MYLQYRLARDIAAMAYGKALCALAPVVARLDPDRREAVLRYLANEYIGFDRSILKLVSVERQPHSDGGSADG